MASKYSKLVGKLPTFEQESTFQMKVEKVKQDFGENIEDGNLSELAAYFNLTRAKKDKLEEEISELNIRLEALSQMIVANMQANEQDSVRLSSGATVFLSYEVYPSVEDKQLLLDWIKAHKMSNQLTLPWQTLRGICNELSLDGQPLPKGVKAFVKTSARIRKNGDS